MQAFKDSASDYPVTSALPITFVLPASGGARDTPLYITLDRDLYPAGSVVVVSPFGTDLYQANPPYSLSVRRAASAIESVIPNTSLTLPVPGNQLVFTVRVSAASGEAIYPTSSIKVYIYNSEAIVDLLEVPVKVVLSEQGIPLRFRLLTANRQLSTQPQGFIFGDYRWRDRVNASSIVPADWSVPPEETGLEKFIAGIGQDDDLLYLRTARQAHSAYPIVRDGEYFTGAHRYFLPSKDAVLEILPINGPLIYTLTAQPESQLPVYVGTYQADSNGNYEQANRYRYLGRGFDLENIWDPTDTGFQYTLERSTKTLTINKGFAVSDLFIGFVPGVTTATLDLPVYPIASLQSVYVESPENLCQIVSFDQLSGQVTLTFPLNVVGARIYASYFPAIAVFYEAAAAEVAGLADPDQAAAHERLLTETDLNPAFAGISGGVLYLMHRRQHASQLILSVDKPRIPIPATLASIVGLVAYGPVYYDKDFALLMATALGPTQAQVLPGVRLRVVPGLGFEGLINYLDPTTQSVEMVTGGDGSAPLIYTPNKSYGYYLDPTASVASGNRIELPTPIPLTQLWDPDDGWYLLTYFVADDSPQFGKVGANVSAGEIPFATYGVAGTVAYRTNGFRTIWSQAGRPAVPSQIYDSAGVAAFLGNGSLNPAFNGNAAELVYGSALPTASNIGAYFISFIGRVLIQVQDVSTGILSNTIMLQLAPPPQVLDTATSGYLYLNSNTSAKHGRLNVNRLGGAPLPQVAFYTNQY